MIAKPEYFEQIMMDIWIYNEHDWMGWWLGMGRVERGETG